MLTSDISTVFGRL